MMKKPDPLSATDFVTVYFKVFAALFFLLAGALQAFDSGFPASRYHHRVWTLADGLPQSTVYALLQTRDHFLWIGTEGGLARFDGKKFTVFNRSNTIGFDANSVTALCEDNSGGLWIGTYGGGVLHYRQGKFTCFGRAQGLTHMNVWSLLAAGRGRLWIGTMGGGLNLLENGRVSRIWNRANGLGDDNVVTMVEDAKKTLWVGTSKGLCRIVDGQPKADPGVRGLPGGSPVKLYIDRGKTLWVATADGLYRKNGEHFERVPAARDFDATFVRSFSEDRQGRLFLGTENGLFQIQAGRPDNVAAGSLLSDQSLMAVLCDREDNLWLGTSAGGLNYLQKSPLRVYDTDQGMSGQRILALLQDSAGVVWAGIHGRGLDRFDGSRWKPFHLSPLKKGALVYALMEDSQKRLWLGTAGDGLILLDKNKVKFFNEQEGLVADSIFSLAQGPDGAIWIGSAAGIFVLRDGRIESVVHAGPLARPIYSLSFDAQGRLYCGGRGPEIFTFYAGSWKSFGSSHGLSGRMVFIVYSHPDGTLWAGTDNGLFRLDKDKFIPCQFSNSASDIQVFGMVADNERRLWLSTNKGLGCLESGAQQAAPVRGMISVPLYFFGEAEGMKSTVCSGGFQPTLWKGNDGRLWFSTQNGVVVLKPQEALRERFSLNALIEEVFADGRQLAPSQLDPLPVGTRRLEIHFTVPFFSAPQQLSFKYRLQGLDRNWRRTRERSVVYEDLPAGRYFFQLLPMRNGKLSHGAVRLQPLSMRVPRARRFTFWHWLGIMLGAVFVGAALAIRQRRNKPAKYILSNLEPGQATAFREKLETCMEREKPYLDPRLTLALLAEKLAMPIKHLSQVINEHYGQNFNDFINGYRIRAAMAKLADEKSREDKLLKIAFESGFNSKSAFNAAFKKITGFSPSEYRQRLGAE